MRIARLRPRAPAPQAATVEEIERIIKAAIDDWARNNWPRSEESWQRAAREIAALCTQPAAPAQPTADFEASDQGGNDLPSLGPLIAARMEVWCAAYDIPSSTLRAIIRQGKGPCTFHVGRLVFITREAWEGWITERAVKGGTGRLSPPSARRAS